MRLPVFALDADFDLPHDVYRELRHSDLLDAWRQTQRAVRAYSAAVERYDVIYRSPALRSKRRADEETARRETLERHEREIAAQLEELVAGTRGYWDVIVALREVRDHYEDARTELLRCDPVLAARLEKEIAPGHVYCFVKVARRQPTDDERGVLAANARTEAIELARRIRHGGVYRRPIVYGALRRAPSGPRKRYRVATPYPVFEVVEEIIEAVNAAAPEDRWHVALRALLEHVIHVVPSARPDAARLLAHARELSGGEFPPTLHAEDLAALTGARFERLTDKPAGGNAKHAIGPVIKRITKTHELPAKSADVLVFDYVSANPNTTVTRAAKELEIRKQDVSSAKARLVAAGRLLDLGRRKGLVAVESFPSRSGSGA